MALTPIIIFHDRHKIQMDDKDWAFAADCTVAWVDDEDLVDKDDEWIMAEKFNKTMILETKNLIDLIQDKPKPKGEFFIL